MAPLSLGGFWGEMCVSGHANLAEYKSSSKCGAPLWPKGSLGGILSGTFEKYFRLMPRDPAKSIFETILSRKRFFKNLDFSKMWDPDIWQSARAAPFTTTRPPLPPVDSSRGGGARARAISQSVSRNLAECFARRRARRCPRRALTGASSSILSCWQRRDPNDLRHQNESPEVIRGSLSSLTERTRHLSHQKGGLGSDFSNRDFSQTRGAAFCASLALCEICVSGIAHVQHFW